MDYILFLLGIDREICGVLMDNIRMRNYDTLEQVRVIY